MNSERIRELEGGFEFHLKAQSRAAFVRGFETIDDGGRRSKRYHLLLKARGRRSQFRQFHTVQKKASPNRPTPILPCSCYMRRLLVNIKCEGLPSRKSTNTNHSKSISQYHLNGTDDELSHWHRLHRKHVRNYAFVDERKEAGISSHMEHEG